MIIGLKILVNTQSNGVAVGDNRKEVRVMSKMTDYAISSVEQDIMREKEKMIEFLNRLIPRLSDVRRDLRIHYDKHDEPVVKQWGEIRSTKFDSHCARLHALIDTYKIMKAAKGS